MNNEDKINENRQENIEERVSALRTAVREAQNRPDLQKGLSTPILESLDALKAGLLRKSLDIVSVIAGSNEDSGVICNVVDACDQVSALDLSNEFDTLSYRLLNSTYGIKKKVKKRKDALILNLSTFSEKLLTAYDSARSACDILESEKPIKDRDMLGQEYNELLIVIESYKECFNIFSKIDPSEMDDFNRVKLEVSLAYIQSVIEQSESCINKMVEIESEHKKLCSVFWLVSEGVSAVRSVKLPRLKTAQRKLIEDCDIESYKVHFNELACKMNTLDADVKTLATPLLNVKHAYSVVENHIFEAQTALKVEI